LTHDYAALGQGLKVPPHVAILVEILEITGNIENCKKLAQLSKKAASHIARQERYMHKNNEIGTNVFIGHGRSPVWKDFKDFIQDRLRLPWDEFNRVPVAGITNIARLSQMLDDAAIAFIIMTAEDELADGKISARMNVIHEVGLFQGRLGFTKAIVLLETGCEEFSNIQGLGQIRFPQGNIKAIFEDIRQVVERENLLNN
jgi:predicted nucleotide-binding protein